MFSFYLPFVLFRSTTIQVHDLTVNYSIRYLGGKLVRGDGTAIPSRCQTGPDTSRTLVATRLSRRSQMAVVQSLGPLGPANEHKSTREEKWIKDGSKQRRKTANS